MSGFGGAGFQVMDVTRLGTTFIPVEGTSSLYTGQLVYSYRYGVEIMGAAGGHGGIGSIKTPYGVIVGNNNKTKLYGSATYGYSDYIVGVNTAADQILRDFRGSEGSEYPKGDPVPLVQVALIDCCSLIRGRIFVTSYGTAPTVGTVTTGGTASFTTNAVDTDGVAYNNIAYCRTGANAGMYRVLDSASTTAHTCTKAFPYTIAVGDTFLCNLPRKGSNVHVIFDSTSMWINGAYSGTNLATNYDCIDVVKVDYSVAGQEHIVFRFSPIHFVPALS